MSSPERQGLRLLPLILLLNLSVVWGLGPTIVKYVALNGIPPLGMVFWQTVIAGLILLTICLVRRTPLRFDQQHVIYYLGMGVVGLTLPNTNMVIVLRELPVSLMGVIVITSPVITYVVALAIRIETFSALRAAGVVLGFAGAATLVLPEGSLPSPALLPVALMAFITPALWAASNVFAEISRPDGSDTIGLAMGTMFAAAGGALVTALVTDTFHPIWADFSLPDLVIVGYGFTTALAFVLFYSVVKLAGAVYLAQVGYLVPLMGVGWGAWLFDERPSVWLWAAMAIIFAGVALVNLSREGRRKG